jgi:hypothetical protein
MGNVSTSLNASVTSSALAKQIIAPRPSGRTILKTGPYLSWSARSARWRCVKKDGLPLSTSVDPAKKLYGGPGIERIERR